MPTSMTSTELKTHLSAVLDDVRDNNERVVVTRNGRPEVVLIAVAELEVLEETLHLLATAGALDQLQRAQKGMDSEKGIDSEKGMDGE